MKKAELDIKSNIFKDIFEVGDDGIPEFKAYLAGKWETSFQKIDVQSPIDGSVIARIPSLTKEQLDKVMDIVYNKGRWDIRNTPGDLRVDFFIKAAEILKEHKEDLINALVINVGKPISNARGEVEATIERLEKVVFDARRILGEYIPGDWSEETLETEGVIKKEPFGIVLGISPFNYPLFISSTKMIPAILAGNAVILKPSSMTPIPPLLFGRILELAGFPKTSFAVLTLRGRDTTYLVQDDRIRVISFTGSTNTGKELTKIAGIKKLHLELGGQDPAIVLADADLELASKRIAKGVTSFSGQRCDAIRLILVEGSVYQKFKELLMKEILRYKLGDPRNEENQMGPLIREKVAEFIDELVKDAIKKGAKVLMGGKRNGAYYEPTLLEISKEKLHELRAFNEEVFGPLTMIVKVGNIDEAIKIANSSRFGLDASIFGENDAKIRKIVRYL
ncbi:MAG: aldehyde dehydrogenase family protein, partial [Candidatus Njordarchaeales archaeon]